jgi:glycosyltransferase involved in cell wall biosynthesis
VIKAFGRVLRIAALRMAPHLHCLPERLRRWLFDRFFGTFSLPRADPAVPRVLGSLRRSDPRAGVNIVGYLRGTLGIGESARLCAGAAKAAAIPYALTDISSCCLGNTVQSEWDQQIDGRNRFLVNVVHVTGEQVPVVASVLGADFFKNRYNVGYWAWELPQLPQTWQPSFALFHEIWTPSTFVQKAVAASSPIPVRCVPHPVPAPPSAGGRSRIQFGLPEHMFLFLTMFDVHSSMVRKNPEGAINAFLAAFEDRRDVGLVIKVQNGASDPARFRALRDRLGMCPHCYLVDRVLTRPEVMELERSCDAYVSLHRSEGFGLCLAECMALGKPVVATGWSGNMDFMDTTNSCPVNYRLKVIEESAGQYAAGQMWAEPDIEHAAALMRRLTDDSDYGAALGRRAVSSIQERFSLAAVGARYREILFAQSGDTQHANPANGESSKDESTPQAPGSGFRVGCVMGGEH